MCVVVRDRGTVRASSVSLWSCDKQFSLFISVNYMPGTQVAGVSAYNHLFIYFYLFIYHNIFCKFSSNYQAC
jgi:hypothetical protein